MGDDHASKAARPIARDLQAELAAAVRVHGEKEVCRLVGVSRNALSRALAGLGVRAGTAVLIKIGLADIRAPRRATA